MANIAGNGPQASGLGAGGDKAAEEVAALRQRMERAMALLRRTRGRRGYLNLLPWYVIIGPPGAGKTTALANCGLDFPLAAELGHGEVGGTGGTYMCEWTFTDQAVLIDTAGRFTTQDSDAQRDRAGWEGFLDMLRQKRPRQPLNGVIVAVGIEHIVEPAEEQRRALARTIRARIGEITQRLKLRLPVYLLFTKFDRIEGFNEFFGDFDKPQRAQVWGMTFPVQIDAAGPAGRFRGEFQALVERVASQTIDHLQAGRTLLERTRIAKFATMLGSFVEPLSGFVEEAFRGGELVSAPWLRGVYLTSATQKDHPIDLLVGDLERRFGINQRPGAPVAGSKGRSFFLDRLVKDVIFNEAMLVDRHSKAGRRHRLLRLAGFGATGIATVFGLVWLGLSVLQGQASVAALNSRLTETSNAYASLQQERKDRGQLLENVPAGGTDMLELLPVLDKARNAAGLPDLSDPLGLTPNEALRQKKRAAYHDLLRALLAPRLVALMEQVLLEHQGDAEYLFDKVAIYHGLTWNDHPEGHRIRHWLRDELAIRFPGPQRAPDRESMIGHADALYDRDSAAASIEPIREWPELLLVTEQAISNWTHEDQALALISSRAQAQGLADFVPGQVAGVAAHFVRRKASLDQPISGFFTPKGFHVLRALLPEAIRETIRGSKARGPNDALAATIATEQDLTRKVIALYVSKFEKSWDALLDELQVVPPVQAGQAVGTLNELAARKGPLKQLLLAITANLAVVEPPKQGEAPEPADLSGAEIDRHFAAMRAYVGNGDDAAIDRHLEALRQISQQIGATIAGGGAPNELQASQLKAMVGDAPEPVRRWLQDLAQSGQASESRQVRDQAAAGYGVRGGPGEQCRALAQKYPFRPGAREDASLESFADVFGPAHGLDAFYAQTLRRFVVEAQGGAPWRAQPAGAVDPPLTDADAQAFQRADAIRKAFFAAGGMFPSVRFQVQLLDLGAEATAVNLTIGGVSARLAAADARHPIAFDWPAPSGEMAASVSLEPDTGGGGVAPGGPWALFRLVDAGHPVLVAGNGQRNLRLTYGQGGQSATLQLSAYPNPFRPNLLSGFTCPSL